jgi:TetR/AcrR family transcriptional repressor of nem operon
MKSTLSRQDRRAATRQGLLDAGLRTLLEKGYHNAGLEEVLHEAGVPKGSFYHWFASKEDFGLQVIDHWVAGYAEAERCLADESLSPLQRLRRHFEARYRRFESNGCCYGCLVGTLGQEMAAQNETFRGRINEILDAWRDRLADCLAQAQQAGEIRTGLEPGMLAEFCVSAWQGALLRGKTQRSTAPLDLFFTAVLDRFLQKDYP